MIYTGTNKKELFKEKRIFTLEDEKRTVGLDADNVIFDFTSSFVYYFNKITGKNLRREDLKQWNFKYALKELYGEDYYKLANEIMAMPDFVLNLKLKPGVYSAFKELCENERTKVLIVTALADDLIPQREKSFKKYFGGLDYEIVYETDKAKIDMHYMVDDGIHNLDNLSTKIAKENCICMIEPYNINCGYPSFKYLGDAVNYIYTKEGLKVPITMAI